MQRRRHHHRHHDGHRQSRKSNLRLYLLVTLACGVLAVLAHFVFEAPAAVRSYAEQRINSAVRSAVRQEVKAAAADQQQSLPVPPR
ncbi:MAG: hypothetical protein O2782_05235 [bacterium]|nr:hypothetical protein [bacterium]